MASTRRKRTLRTLHRWAGLLAAVWLLILGATGIVLDHPDWRRPNQITVPESWGSPELTRFIRITLMRHVLADADNDQRWLGGSERGLWRSKNGGESWSPVRFAGLDYSPQVLGIVTHPRDGFDMALVATDDGVWRVLSDDTVERVALRGHFINSLAHAGSPEQVIGVADRSDVFEISLDGDVTASRWIQSQAIAPVIAGDVALSRFILNLHFGHGLAEGTAGVLINDFGGIAMVVLATTGLLYWYLRRRWRKRPDSASPKTKRNLSAWLYRSHAPVIGTLAVVPILYLSITGIAGNHIRAFYDWASDVAVPAAIVPAGFSMRSLDGDIQDIVAVPGADKEWLIATRKGLYRSSDGGQVWLPEDILPIQRADYGNSLNLFRAGDALFLGAGLDANFASQDGGLTWHEIQGPFTGISSGAVSESRWYLKNSQGVFAGDSLTEVTLTPIKPPPLTGMPLFLFLADVHTGHAIHPAFPWISDLLTLFAIVLAVTGPILWWRRKWL